MKTYFHNHLIRLDFGEPSFPPPNEAKAEAIKYITNPKCQYEALLGNQTLRDLIVKNTRVKIDDNQVLITSGGLMGINVIVKTLSQEGIKKVFYPNPGFPPYQFMDKLSNVNLIPYDFLNKQKLIEDLHRMSKEINEKAIFIITSPNNPNGLFLQNNEWKKIYTILKGHYIIRDDSFENFTYISEGKDDNEEEIGGSNKDNVFKVYSFSKTYSLADYRVGYVIAPNSIYAEKLAKNHWNEQLSTSTVSQRAAIGALKASSDYLNFNKNHVEENLIFAMNRLCEEAIEVDKPEGGFFLWINIQKTGLSASDFVTRCLKEKNLSLMSGEAFGENGEGFIRINCATETVTLKEGIKRFISFYQERMKAIEYHL
jgi:aspartate/methionine/tyrosine aminotransferase